MIITQLHFCHSICLVDEKFFNFVITMVIWAEKFLLTPIFVMLVGDGNTLNTLLD